MCTNTYPRVPTPTYRRVPTRTHKYQRVPKSIDAYPRAPARTHLHRCVPTRTDAYPHTPTRTHVCPCVSTRTHPAAPEIFRGVAERDPDRARRIRGVARDSARPVLLLLIAATTRACIGDSTRQHAGDSRAGAVTSTLLPPPLTLPPFNPPPIHRVYPPGPSSPSAHPVHPVHSAHPSSHPSIPPHSSTTIYPHPRSPPTTHNPPPWWTRLTEGPQRAACCCCGAHVHWRRVQPNKVRITDGVECHVTSHVYTRKRMGNPVLSKALPCTGSQRAANLRHCAMTLP